MISTHRVNHTHPVALEPTNQTSVPPTPPISKPQEINPVAKVFNNMPEVLILIIKELPRRDLVKFARVNKGIYNCAKPFLMHAGLSMSPLLRLNFLAEATTPETIIGKLKGNIFIFKCLLQNTQRQAEALRKQLKFLLPFKNLTEGILTEEEIKDIVASVVPLKDQGAQEEKTPIEKLQALKEAGLLSAQQIQQLQAHGGVTAIKVNSLCSSNGVLTLLHEPNPDLEAFARIPDDGIKLKGTMELIRNLQGVKEQPENAQRAAQVIVDLVKSKLFINTYLYLLFSFSGQDFPRHTQVIRTLLEQGLPPNQPDNNGMTALHHAARDGNIEALECLLKHDANLNQLDNEGMTALHHAVQKKNPPVVMFLVRRSEQDFLNLRNKKGETLVELAGGPATSMGQWLIKQGVVPSNDPEVTNIA